VVVSRSRFDSTVASFRRTRVRSDVLRVTFSPEFKSFCGNGSSESTHFPEGLCWGIREKTIHPRNVGFIEVHKISFRVMCENSIHIWLLRVNLPSISGRLKSAKLWNHEPAKNLNHEPAKTWSQESANTWSQEHANIWNNEPVKIWNHEPMRLRSLRLTKA
jgi:hypothetical protein